MIKRIIALFISVVTVLSLAGCGSAKATRPALYDENVLTIEGENFTYEYYRHFYYSAKESNVGDTEEAVFKYILEKLLYDKAVDLLLKDKAISLTEAEIEEIRSYVSMFEASMPTDFYNELSNRKMTVDVFCQSLIDMSQYNKLYAYYEKEENKALDFSKDSVLSVLNKYDAGLHFVVTVNDNRTSVQAKMLADKVSSLMNINNSFKTLNKIFEIKTSINESQSAIDAINNQIANGSNDSSLITSLDTLVNKVGQLKDELAKLNDSEAAKNELTAYIENVDKYASLVKSEITSSATSNDTELLSAVNGDITALKKYITDTSISLIEKNLVSALENVYNATTSYGWLSSEFKTAITEFKENKTVEAAKKLDTLHNASSEMKKDTLLTNINKVVNSYITIKSGEASYKVTTALKNANGLLEIKTDSIISASQLAEAIEAKTSASEILEALNLGALKANEIGYESLANVFALCIDFEELIKLYSDGYNSEADTQLFYYQTDTLLNELIPEVEKLEPGQYTGVVQSKDAYHIFMRVDEDADHFKNNYFVYASLEDIILEKSKTVSYTLTELYNSLSDSKITELEKELGVQIAEIKEAADKNNAADSGTLIWTIVIIASSIVVLGILTIAIINAGKAPSYKATANTSKGKSNSAPKKKSEK